MVVARGWRNASVLEDGGLRTELCFVPSGGADVFATVYAATPQTLPFKLLVCPAWGYESITFRDWQHRVAAGLARRGAVGVAFDYPGHGDSGGSADATVLETLVASATDAAAHVNGSFEGEWIVAGVRLGAAVAAHAARSLGAAGLLLFSPELDPEAHFRDVLRQSRVATFHDPAGEGLAFGVPVSDALLTSAIGSAAAVQAAVESVPGRVAAVRIDTRRTGTALPSGVDTITVAASPKDRAQERRRVLEASLGWLDGLVRG